MSIYKETKSRTITTNTDNSNGFWFPSPEYDRFTRDLVLSQVTIKDITYDPQQEIYYLYDKRTGQSYEVEQKMFFYYYLESEIEVKEGTFVITAPNNSFIYGGRDKTQIGTTTTRTETNNYYTFQSLQPSRPSRYEADDVNGTLTEYTFPFRGSDGYGNFFYYDHNVVTQYDIKTIPNTDLETLNNSNIILSKYIDDGCVQGHGKLLSYSYIDEKNSFAHKDSPARRYITSVTIRIDKVLKTLADDYATTKGSIYSSDLNLDRMYPYSANFIENQDLNSPIKGTLYISQYQTGNYLTSKKDIQGELAVFDATLVNGKIQFIRKVVAEKGSIKSFNTSPNNNPRDLGISYYPVK